MQEGDTINFSGGQAGSVGRDSHSHDNTFQQNQYQGPSKEDLKTLGEQLARLRMAMRKDASEPEHDEALGHIAAAQKAAESGNEAEASRRLKAAGKWALSVAEKIGVDVAAASIKVAMGL